MIKVILCEGKTDAILLSYYLEKVSGWKYSKKMPKNFAIKPDNDNQSVNCYAKNSEQLLICAVGGKDGFEKFYQDKLSSPILDSNVINRLAIIIDRDDNGIKSIEKRFSESLNPVISKMKNNEWIQNTYKDSYRLDQQIETLLVVVPQEYQGALENVMLDSISEDPYDKVIVNKTGEFVKEMRAIASNYIYNNRTELKAHLGVTWAIQYPEKVFSLIDEQIRSVEWEKSEVLKKCFEVLEVI
jgi:hypothetical protein